MDFSLARIVTLIEQLAGRALDQLLPRMAEDYFASQLIISGSFAILTSVLLYFAATAYQVGRGLANDAFDRVVAYGPLKVQFTSWDSEPSPETPPQLAERAAREAAGAFSADRIVLISVLAVVALITSIVTVVTAAAACRSTEHALNALMGR